ncbi:MAG: pyridoxamine kinase [Eubacterium sp.]|nr:pyridoxamine kinase [Eubacterium sp.]MDE6767417.1 pyridoxamine kinase [Eubacterium sp.]
MKRCAIINDLSGFGKCSLTAAMPIISVMGSEVHPLPTAVLSNQTAYDSFMQRDLTEHMNDYINEWKKLGVTFDAILTGFVTSEKQLDIISCFIDEFKTEKTTVIVDPVMADNGALYSGYTNAMCKKIKQLCHKADIVTPNIAELAFLADEEYSENMDDINHYANKLQCDGIERIVVTGYKSGDMISNLVYDNDDMAIASSALIGGYYSGTGDILASIITGGVLKGMTLVDSVVLATEFISKVIADTDCENHNDGIDFEKHLRDLI